MNFRSRGHLRDFVPVTSNFSYTFPCKITKIVTNYTALQKAILMKRSARKYSSHDVLRRGTRKREVGAMTCVF